MGAPPRMARSPAAKSPRNSIVVPASSVTAEFMAWNTSSSVSAGAMMARAANALSSKTGVAAFYRGGMARRGASPIVRASPPTESSMTRTIEWCPGRDLNPHSRFQKPDFKSGASADSATRAR